jgi:hypothetical protein
MNKQQIIDWLLEGDVSIQYQVWRDLLDVDKKQLQARVAREGWGRHILMQRHENGHWGDRFYQPKWISTHYTLLDLRHLNLASNNAIAQEAIELVLQDGKAEDGGIPLGPSTTQHSDVCVNAMVLNYASYFKTSEKKLHSIVDSILNELMPDGGFNCRTTRSGAKHSSLHTTLSVLEGFTQFQKEGHTYRAGAIQSAIKSATAFILLHQLFLSDRTGKIIHKDFLKFTYPCRWRYDILRALDYFQYAEMKWDNSMEAAMRVLEEKRNKEGTWNMQAAHPGQVHVVMEKAGKASRWNTLRAMRVLKYFNRK